jgi:hypothetical protein
MNWTLVWALAATYICAVLAILVLLIRPSDD